MLLAAVVLVGVLGLAGGYEEATPANLQQFSAVTSPITIAAKPVEVVVNPPVKKEREVEVALTVTARTDSSVVAYDLANMIELSDATGKKSRALFTRSKPGAWGSTVSAISPDVPTQIVASWKTGDLDTSQPLKLTVNSMTYRKSSLDGHMGWFDAEPAGEVEI